MMQTLPYKDLTIESHISLHEILDTSKEGPVGYIVEVDVEFPGELHDKFRQVPLALQTCPNS